MSTTVTFELIDNSVVIHGWANGYPVNFILDTGDAIGPVFNANDAQQLGLQPEGEIDVSGAGGETENYTTTATVKLGNIVYEDEPCAIDPNLEGPSLLGLPFFLNHTNSLTFDWPDRILTID